MVMFFCGTCQGRISKKIEGGIPCFGQGRHIDPNAIFELAGKTGVRILVQNGVECFVYDTKGDKGDTIEVYVPLDTHPNVIRWDPVNTHQPALF